MKKSLLLLVFIASFFANSMYAQTNSFPNDGNVGIGTTSPTNKLEVIGGVKFKYGKFLYEPHSDVNYMRLSFDEDGHFQRYYMNAGFDIQPYGGPYTGISLNVKGMFGTGIQSNVYNEIYSNFTPFSGKFIGGQFSIARDTEEATISDFFVALNGNIGIRTNTPTVALDVNGDIKAANFYSSNGQLLGSNWDNNTNRLSTSKMVTINSAKDRADDEYALTINGLISPVSQSAGNGQCLLVKSFSGNLIKSETTTGIAIYGKAGKYLDNVGYSGYFVGGKFSIKPYEGVDYNQFGYGLDAKPNGYYMNAEMYINPYGAPYSNGTSLNVKGGYDGTAILATASSVISGTSYSGQFLGGDFKIARDDASKPDFSVNSQGNILIGASTPYTHNSEIFKLSVDGKIACTGLRVTSSWADFVFDDNYKLRSLSEVESFIKENKHLPDVPAAASVEKNGLDVGEMQTVMMQKIEELTLYIIEQQKNIDEQKKIMKEQQKQITELQTLIK